MTSGLLLPTTGSVCLAGQPLPPEPWAVTAAHIARTPASIRKDRRVIDAYLGAAA
ncbi:hypothetical protein [Bradyrhizobium cosmicum]|uniref:ABC transporter ATP-binding protein C-terminal domain-containing protein n=1 Tax=Bradyrhizobium cosmicum TaxID=1404864 RepID=UPI00030B6545